MDLGRSLGYPMRDPNWVIKLIIGTVIAMIPILNFIAGGYMLRALRQVMQGDDNSLPEWDDFGGDFMRGLVGLLGSLIYFFPLLIFTCCLSVFSGLVGDENGAFASFVSLCIITPGSLIYSIVVGPMLALAYIAYAETEDFSAAFMNFGARFREVRDNLGTVGMYILYYLIIQIALGLVVGVTIWLCGLGLVFAWWSYLSITHLTAKFGQEIRRGAVASI